MCHIESKQCKRNNSEYEIFVNLENQAGGDVPLPLLSKSLKRQFSYIKINDSYEKVADRQSNTSLEKQEDDLFVSSPKADADNDTVFTNLNGELIRKIEAEGSRHIFMYYLFMNKTFLYIKRCHGFLSKYPSWIRLRNAFCFTVRTIWTLIIR